jgi:predicted aldo/keto reductase-like oxidoreductase
MLRRTIGSTGVDVSILGFGCMRLPVIDGQSDRVDHDKAVPLLRTAIERGVNYVDTAWFYHAKQFGQAGASEPFVGEALSGGWRERVKLATKLPQQIVQTRDDMDRYLEQQLERLRTDHLDFYLVHGVNGDSWERMRDLGVREFLDKARDEGLIRFPAFSFHGAAPDFPRIIDEYDGWAFGQLQYNYMDIDFQAGYSGLRYAAEKGIGIVVMEPLKGGKLAVNLPREMQAVFDARPEGWSPAQWALRYVWNEPGVSLLLSGMNSIEQLEENLATAEEGVADTLSAGQLAVYAEARDALASRTKVDCTSCRYCKPCPAGVDIPECFAALNAANMWEDTNPWLTGYVQVQGKASLCEECGQCEDMCPQGLPIRELLKETAKTFGQ